MFSEARARLGSRDLEEENAADFGFDPSAVDTLLLTHAPSIHTYS